MKVWEGEGIPTNLVRKEIKILANDQLDAQIFIHLLQSSTCTCFEQYHAHPQNTASGIVAPSK